MQNVFEKIYYKIFPPSVYPFYIRGRTDVIFIHITKTAGTSVARTLNCCTVKETGQPKHRTALQIINEIGQKKYDNAFKCTFVRNPWDRMLSYYRFKRDVMKNLPYLKTGNFNDWILDPAFDQQLLTDQYLAVSQVDWLVNTNGKVDIDFIGRFENLSADFEKLCQQINVTPAKPLRKVVVSGPTLNYRDVYTPESKAVVDKLYQRDIEYFGYTF